MGRGVSTFNPDGVEFGTYELAPGTTSFYETQRPKKAVRPKNASTSKNEAKPWRTALMATAAGLGMFLATLDIAVNVALPAMTEDLDADLQSIQWGIVAFIATRAGLVL